MWSKWPWPLTKIWSVHPSVKWMLKGLLRSCVWWLREIKYSCTVFPKSSELNVFPFEVWIQNGTSEDDSSSLQPVLKSFIPVRHHLYEWSRTFWTFFLQDSGGTESEAVGSVTCFSPSSVVPSFFQSGLRRSFSLEQWNMANYGNNPCVSSVSASCEIKGHSIWGGFCATEIMAQTKRSTVKGEKNKKTGGSFTVGFVSPTLFHTLHL